MSRVFLRDAKIDLIFLPSLQKTLLKFLPSAKVV